MPGGRPPFDRDDADRVRRLAESRAYDGLPADAAEIVVRRVVDAVVDTMPRTPPVPRGRDGAR